MYHSIALAEVNNDDDDCNGVSNRSRNRSRSPPVHRKSEIRLQLNFSIGCSVFRCTLLSDGNCKNTGMTSTQFILNTVFSSIVCQFCTQFQSWTVFVTFITLTGVVSLIFHTFSAIVASFTSPQGVLSVTLQAYFHQTNAITEALLADKKQNFPQKPEWHAEN